MFAYRDKGVNPLVVDSRFSSFLEANLPAIPFPGTEDSSHPPNPPINKDAIRYLAVPGDLEISGQRYLSASGCMAHACIAAEAMIWIDTASNTVLFVVNHGGESNNSRATRYQYPIESWNLYIFSKVHVQSDKLPDEFRRSVIRWLHLTGVLRVAEVTLLMPDGSEPVTTDELGWTIPRTINGVPAP